MTELVRRGRSLPLGLVLVLALGVLVILTNTDASAATRVVRSTVKGTDGKTYWVTNPPAPSSKAGGAAAGGKPVGHHESLLVWAGDANAGDTKGSDIQSTPLGINPVKTTNEDAIDHPP